jgi:hypothetical protein
MKNLHLRPEERLKKLAHGLLGLLVHALQHHHHRLQGFNRFLYVLANSSKLRKEKIPVKFATPFS